MGPLYEKSCMILVVHVPKLGWPSHWLGTAELQHLRWQEPVHVTDELQALRAWLRRDGAAEFGSELEQGLAPYSSELCSGGVCWKLRRTWASPLMP